MAEYARIIDQVFEHDPRHVDTVRRLVAREATDRADELVLLEALGLEP